jgi:hypothetical protein
LDVNVDFNIAGFHICHGIKLSSVSVE